MELVYVEWVDAHGGSGQYSLEEVEKSHTDYMSTAGILIRDDEESVVLAQDAFKYNEQPDQVRCYEVIPKVNIIRKLIFPIPPNEADNGSASQSASETINSGRRNGANKGEGALVGAEVSDPR